MLPQAHEIGKESFFDNGMDEEPQKGIWNNQLMKDHDEELSENFSASAQPEKALSPMILNVQTTSNDQPPQGQMSPSISYMQPEEEVQPSLPRTSVDMKTA